VQVDVSSEAADLGSDRLFKVSMAFLSSRGSDIVDQSNDSVSTTASCGGLLVGMPYVEGWRKSTRHLHEDGVVI